MKELTPINELGIATPYHSIYKEEVFKFLRVIEKPEYEITGKKSGKIYPINHSFLIQTDPDILSLIIGRDYSDSIKGVREFSNEELILEGRKIIERIVNIKKDVEAQLTSFANEHNFKKLDVLGKINLKLHREFDDDKISTHIKNSPGGLLLGYDGAKCRSDFLLRFKNSYKRINHCKIVCPEIETGDVKWFNGIPVYCIRLVNGVIGQMVDQVINDIIEKHGFRVREFVMYVKKIQQMDFKLLNLLLPYAYQNHADICMYVKTNTDYCRRIILNNSYAHAFRKNGREIEFTHFSDVRNLNWHWEMQEYYSSTVQNKTVEEE